MIMKNAASVVFWYGYFHIPTCNLILIYLACKNQPICPGGLLLMLKCCQYLQHQQQMPFFPHAFQHIQLWSDFSMNFYTSLTFTYRMSHRVHATFKLVYGHLNGIFLTSNFAWAFSRPFANSGQKDFAKF